MKNTSAKAKMSKNLKTISWDAPMIEAWESMDKNNFRHLPVTDKSGAIIGILSDRDVNKAMNPDRPGFALGCQVKDFMNWPVITVDESGSIKDVANEMIVQKISAVLVSRRQQVVGILTSEDLLRFLVESLGNENKSSILDLTYQPLVSELIRETQSVGI